MFRCPGGKRRIAKTIVDRILKQCRDRPIENYCEPFAATASVCLRLLKTVGGVKKVWLNDLDPGTFALWWCVVHDPQEYLNLVEGFKPTKEAFFMFKNELLTGAKFDLPELALRKIVVHQLGYSGLGVMAGGTTSPFGSRWSPRQIRKNVAEARRLLAGKDVLVTKLDFREVLRQVDAETYVYADPPYLTQSKELYQYAFRAHDHEDLRAILAGAKFRWLLSYDDCPEIRRMYQQDEIHELQMTYSINGSREKNELLISPCCDVEQPELEMIQWPSKLGNASTRALWFDKAVSANMQYLDAFLRQSAAD
jgi:DNA adenine methylase